MLSFLASVLASSNNGHQPPAAAATAVAAAHIFNYDDGKVADHGNGEQWTNAAKGVAIATDTADEDDGFLTFCTDFNAGLPEALSAAACRDYRVVAVTGCQCSGKSTLLNALFGTGYVRLCPKKTVVYCRT